jgi:transcription elongation factor GreA
MNELELSPEVSSGILLTAQGYETLQRELEHLTTVKRPEIADRIRESQQHGEFSEDNSELDEVKFEQAMVESRIAELKTIFGNAHVLEPEHIPTDRVGVGSLVTLEDLQYGDSFDVRIVSTIEADPSHDLISTESPLGLALMGQSADSVIEFNAPEGVKRYKVIEIRK